MQIKDNALLLAHLAHQQSNGDVRQSFVALMTAAAIAGHIIERTPEDMHKVLGQVMDVAEATLLEATQTKH